MNVTSAKRAALRRAGLKTVSFCPREFSRVKVRLSLA
jgi:hypothetical protein